MDRTRPAILILPGGGYGHTSEREAEPVAMRFVAAGYAAFVLHYSCAPSRFPTALREAAMAMGYIRQNARRFAVHPHKVAALGFSPQGAICAAAWAPCMTARRFRTWVPGRRFARMPWRCAIRWRCPGAGPMRAVLTICAAGMLPSGSGCLWKSWFVRICLRYSSDIPGRMPRCPAETV